MSHFSILVVGNVDYNMAPFGEFECIGENNEFVKTIDITKSVKKDFQKAIKDQKKNKDEKYGFKGTTFYEYLKDYEGYNEAESPNQIDTEGDHKYNYFYKVGEDDYKVFRRTNPNSFYDYYGDGYKGLKLKKPIKELNYKTGKEEETFYTNSAKVKDVDFQGKWAEKEQAARELYRKVINALGYVPTLETPWASLVDKFHPKKGKAIMTRDKAIEIYNEQQAVKDFEQARKDGKLTYEDIGLWTSVDEYAMSEDEYVKSQHIHAITFGYVINRKYHSNGDMGWWAMVSNEKDPNAWDEEYQKFIESLNPEDEITILDCHV